MSKYVIDNEQLISFVYKKQAIWDKRVKEHSNRHYVEKCWKDISLKMKIPEEKLRKKWKYLRDQFATELSKLKPQQSGDEDSKTETSKWQHFKSLYFLKDIIKYRPIFGHLIKPEKYNQNEFQYNEVTSKTLHTADNKNEDDIAKDKQAPEDARNRDCDEHVQEKILIKSEIPILRIENLSPITGAIPQTSTPGSSRIRHKLPLLKRRKRLKADEYTTCMLEIEKRKVALLKQKIEKRKSNDSEDENWHFFKSVLPHVKRIRHESILAFRSKIQDLIQEFAYPITTDSSTSTLSIPSETTSSYL